MDDRVCSRSCEEAVKGTRRKRKRKRNIVNSAEIDKNKRNKSIVIMGTNANGIKSKKESLFSLINLLQPSIITIQESFMKKPGQIKIPGYQIFEKVRETKNGGGLLSAITEDLEPVLVDYTDHESEMLSVQINVNDLKIRIINAYGPQEKADDDPDVYKFWKDLEIEIIRAKDDGCAILIQMDANS